LLRNNIYRCRLKLEKKISGSVDRVDGLASTDYVVGPGIGSREGYPGSAA